MYNAAFFGCTLEEGKKYSRRNCNLPVTLDIIDFTYQLAVIIECVSVYALDFTSRLEPVSIKNNQSLLASKRSSDILIQHSVTNFSTFPPLITVPEETILSISRQRQKAPPICLFGLG